MRYYLIIILIIISSNLAAAGENVAMDDGTPAGEKNILSRDKTFNLSLSAGVSLMQGSTTYQIGGHVSTPTGSDKVQFPLSELEFPLNVYMANIKAGLEYGGKWRLNTGLKKNISRDGGRMKDSDWGIPWEDPPGSGTYYWYGPDHLDIYSESKTRADAVIADAELMYRFKEMEYGTARISFYGGLGYRYQNYSYECRLIRQRDYRAAAPPWEKQDAQGDGRVGLTYTVISYIPYIKFSPEIKVHDFIYFEAGVGYSPFVKLKDRDNHILRSKISKGECEGYALMFSISARAVFRNFFMEIVYAYDFIYAKGKQKQYDSGVWSATIEQKNFSTARTAGVSIGYNF